MKTLQELYDEVISSDELKKEFISASSDGSGAKAFLEMHGCDSSLEELSAFLKEKFDSENGGMKELEDADLDEVAGGGKDNAGRIAKSVLSLGMSCAQQAAKSAYQGDVDKCMDVQY